VHEPSRDGLAEILGSFDRGAHGAQRDVPQVRLVTADRDTERGQADHRVARRPNRGDVLGSPGADDEHAADGGRRDG